ncbi:MAG: hypothetical protein K8T91_03450 [Planctomycetes bacterium]|nr:hypothetical protein [Planctomycetota bacterium]
MSGSSSVGGDSSNLNRREIEIRVARAKLDEEAARLKEEARELKRRRGQIAKKPKASGKSEQAEAEVEAKALPPRPGVAAPSVPMRPAARPSAKPQETTRTPLRPGETASPAATRGAAVPIEASNPRAEHPRAEHPRAEPGAMGDPSDDEPSLGWIGTCRLWIAEVGGAYLASMLFHAALFIGLFLFLGARYIHQKLNEGTSFDSVELTQLEDENLKTLQLDQPLDGQPTELDLNALVQGDKDSKLKDGDAVTQSAKYFDDSPTFEDEGGGLKSAAVDAPQLGGASFDFSTFKSGPAMKGPGGLGGGGGEGVSSGLGGSGSGPLGGRGKGSRKATVARKGGNVYSEAAVEAALKWIAAHQNADGSWSYNHQLGGKCQCGNPGGATGSFGSTGLALLPFLSAGYTHKEGKYKKTVEGGLKHLVSTMQLDAAKGTGKMFGGNEHMYAHGLATIALTEAYGMTKDSKLKAPAQAALNWIIATQSQDRNFWGYEGGGGDTSVSGWQIMALKSGRGAYLNVPQLTLDRVTKGLDGVQSESGAYYGYGGPGKTPAMTAVGLLSRMYLGANRNNPALERGMTYLAQTGPDLKNMYYTYYANQAMFQYTNGEGPQWKLWNGVLRDGLIKTQFTQGHESGSWNQCAFIAQGGRLYATSLCCMSLQIYYRYVGVYQRGAGHAGPGGAKKEIPAEGIGPIATAEAAARKARIGRCYAQSLVILAYAVVSPSDGI